MDQETPIMSLAMQRLSFRPSFDLADFFSTAGVFLIDYRLMPMRLACVFGSVTAASLCYTVPYGISLLISCSDGL